MREYQTIKLNPVAVPEGATIPVLDDDGFVTRAPSELEEFESGAVRGSRDGKGRYDLFSPLALGRVAGVNERGGKIVGERNYEKGIPVSRFIDSGIRHTMQYMEGKRDEDHLAQAVWNLLAALHTDEAIRRGVLPEELADTPNYTV